MSTENHDSLKELAGISNGADGDRPLVAGRYEVQREIGRGGMGVVYLSQDVKLMRHVAIKRLITKSSNTKVVQRRFLREAQTIASLTHVNIVSIFDIGQDDKGYYIIMEYVPGVEMGGNGDSQLDPPSPVNLDNYVKAKGPMEPEDARQLIIKVCGALEYAHHQGIIHRDIKPSNILLNPKLEPKLVDFGLARPIDISKSEEITLEGTILGTPEYSAPEQWGDVKAVGVPADVYALAGVFWFALSGKVPRYFREGEVPSDMKESIAKALSQRPQDRFKSMSDFSQSLQKKAIGMQTVVTGGPPSTMTFVGAHESHAAAATLATSRLWICPQCNLPSPDAASFCVNCGASCFDDCSVCTKPVRVGAQFCPHCGADVKNAEESATTLQTAKKQAEFMEYESAMESIRDLASKNNNEAQKLTKEWRQVVLKRRNLLMDLDSAIRVFNLEKAVNVAVELKTMCPEECLSESQDFDVVVKFSTLMTDLKQLLVEAAHRAQEEFNLEKYEQSIEYLNRVYGREACAAVNDQLLQTQTALDNALANAGFGLGWNCFSRAMEVLSSVPPWRGGDQGERRIRLYTSCKEMIEKREGMIDSIEQALRESRFSDALMQIQGMAEFRLPPNNSEMEPAAEDLDAHHRIVNIDKILTKQIEERVEQWIEDDQWHDIVTALTILSSGESGAWRRASETLRVITNREIVRRYNKAVELERKGKFSRAQASWDEFMLIPQELAPPKLYHHAEEFDGRKHAYRVKQNTKIVRRGTIFLGTLWVLFIFYVIFQLIFNNKTFIYTKDKQLNLSGLGASGIQFLFFLLGFFVIRWKKWVRQEERGAKGKMSPRMLGFCLLMAFSPLSYLFSEILAKVVGKDPTGNEHTLYVLLGVGALWLIFDVVRAQGFVLPGALAMTLAWIFVAPIFYTAFNHLKENRLGAAAILSVSHGIAFLIVQVIHGFMHAEVQRKPQEENPDETDEPAPMAPPPSG